MLDERRGKGGERWKKEDVDNMEPYYQERESRNKTAETLGIGQQPNEFLKSKNHYKEPSHLIQVQRQKRFWFQKGFQPANVHKNFYGHKKEYETVFFSRRNTN